MESNGSTVAIAGKDVPVVEQGDDTDQGRGNWGGKFEFVLTCIGYSVGLGNVWRFPYLCHKNGGGAFLIPYFICLLAAGLPMYLLELSFGQFASLGPTKIWQLSPAFKGVGFTMVVVCLVITMYYNVIVAWIFFYLFSSMTSKLPWTDCTNDWNTEFCVDKEIKDLRNNMTRYNLTTVGNYTMVPDNMTKTPSEEYFYRFVLNISDGLEQPRQLEWKLAILMLVAWIIVFLVLIKGIKSLGKTVYFTATFPYLMMTVMLIRGVTLDGAKDGIMYYLTPRVEKLMEASVWSDAATQIFYSLGPGLGNLIAMASYNKFNNNIMRDGLIIPLINCMTSFYGGFVIFSVLGFMAKEKGVSVEAVADEGPGLVFVVYPEGLAQMPVAPLWACLFFLMLLAIGLSSQFSMVESGFVAILDDFPALGKGYRMAILRGVSCLFFYVICLPMVTSGGFYLFNIVDTYVGGFPLLFAALFEALIINWVYGIRRFSEDVELMIGKKPFIYWRIAWPFIIPAVLIAIIIFKAIQHDKPTLFAGTYIYPDWAMVIAWVIVGGCVCFIPGYFLYYFCRKGGFKVLKQVISPTPEWGPALAENRTGKYAKPVEVEYADTIPLHNYQNNSLVLQQYQAPLNNGGLYPLVSSIHENGKPTGHENVAFDDAEIGNVEAAKNITQL